MHTCPYSTCEFQSTDECYLSLHLSLDHSNLLPGAAQELLTQLSTQLLSDSRSMIQITLMRKRLPTANPLLQEEFSIIIQPSHCSQAS